MYLHRNQPGQVLLIVILIMVVVLTIVLSLATRSVTNTRLTSQDQDSKRALSAAEAGIEQALKKGSTVGIGANIGTNATIKQITLNTLSGTDVLVNNGLLISRDDGADVWFVDHKADGTPDYTTPKGVTTLTVSWGKSGEVCSSSANSNTMAAIEVIVVSGPVGSPRATRTVFDPCTSAPARQASINFDTVVTPGRSVQGIQFAYQNTITGMSNALFARIIPLYADTSVGVTANVALPNQGTVVDALGSAGNAQRRVNTFRGYPKLPTEFFPYGIFAPQS
jgi:Tfp pilus assembly protein PilX